MLVLNTVSHFGGLFENTHDIWQCLSGGSMLSAPNQRPQTMQIGQPSDSQSGGIGPFGSPGTHSNDFLDVARVSKPLAF